VLGGLALFWAAHRPSVGVALFRFAAR
jgi:hypothetical protein